MSISLDHPNVPTITSLISTSSDMLTVTWTSVLNATSYGVCINDSANTIHTIPSIGAPQYTFTGLTKNTVYTVSVVAINCAGSSSPATITGRTGKYDKQLRYSNVNWDAIYMYQFSIVKILWNVPHCCLKVRIWMIFLTRLISYGISCRMFLMQLIALSKTLLSSAK